MKREDTRVIQIGNRKIGGGNPIAIQSMTNTKTEDVEATVAQILALEAAGWKVAQSDPLKITLEIPKGIIPFGQGSGGWQPPASP